MSEQDVSDWLASRSTGGAVWYVKRLSGNDTLANGTHQAGPYIPKELLFELFPRGFDATTKNPRILIPISIDSHGVAGEVSAIWYNNKLFGGTRNETRLTGFGGRSSPLLDADNTGALAVFAFVPTPVDPCRQCLIWVCRGLADEREVESVVGSIEPGEGTVWRWPGGVVAESLSARGGCWLDAHQLPPDWLTAYPSPKDIVRKTIEMRGTRDGKLRADARLIERRNCEYDIYRSIEYAVEMPVVEKGFRTLEEFLSRAQSIVQRRRARGGTSLELQVKHILLEEKLVEGRDFESQAKTEGERTPDFLFPSRAAYLDPAFPSDKLRMLAVKSTCKDRWRQVLTEARRVPEKHLLTLQEGVSENQFREMREENLRLVVPEPLVRRFPESVRPHLTTLTTFIHEVAGLRGV
jgi:hypothetical protein